MSSTTERTRQVVADGLLVWASNGEEDQLLGFVDSATHKVEILADWARWNIGRERKKVTARYYTAATPLSGEALREAAIRTIIGAATTDYGAHYSELTGYLWTDEKLQIGGHDLIEELRSHVGRYCRLEIDVHGERS